MPDDPSCETCGTPTLTLQRYDRNPKLPNECGTCWKYRTRHNGKTRPQHLIARQEELSYQRWMGTQPTANFSTAVPKGHK